MNITLKVAAIGMLLSSSITAYFVSQAEQNTIHNNVGHTVLMEATQFNGHYYRVYDYGMTWNDARDFCQKMGGHLVTITSKSENELVKQLISNEHSKETYWIGGYKDENSNWSWVTDENFSYSKWATGEPNNINYRENNIEMYNSRNSKDEPLGSWNDVTENVLMPNRGFICEWEHDDSD